jgi:hypothetical protein
VLLLGAVAACGRTGFASLPCTDAPPDVAIAPASHSTLTLDKKDPALPLADFPLLVTLDDSRAARDLLDATASNIRFLDSSGNVLPHEIDQVGVAGLTGAPLLAWVRMPSITGLTTTLEVEVGGALPDPSPLSVWSTDYEAVYHLNDGNDATTHHHDGTGAGAVTPVFYPGCAIGSCQSFDGISAAITIPDAPTLDLPKLTVTGWMYQRSAATAVMTLISRQAGAGNEDFALDTTNRTTEANVVTSITGAANVQGSMITLGHWTHLALTEDGGILALIIDGGGINTTVPVGDVMHHPNDVLIGTFGGGNGWLDGMADEIRLERVVRDPKWVAYEDVAMRDGVISYGPIER